MRTRAVALLLCAALALGSCGGGGGGGDRSEKADPAKDRVKAQGLLLVAADFPAGWKSSPHTTDPETKALAKQLAACAGAPDPDAVQTADVDGSDFSHGPGAEVSSSASYVRTRADADADLAAVRGPRFEGCARDELTKVVTKQLPTGVALQSVTLTRRTVGTYGEATEAFRVSADVAGQGVSLAADVDLVLLRKGRAEVTASFTDLGNPFDAALERTLLAKLGARLHAA